MKTIVLPRVYPDRTKRCGGRGLVSRLDFRCGQGVKHENLLGQDLDRGRGWKYRRLCSVPPWPVSVFVLEISAFYKNLVVRPSL